MLRKTVHGNRRRGGWPAQQIVLKGLGWRRQAVVHRKRHVHRSRMESESYLTLRAEST
jgi:hypothetical protein